MEDERVFKLTIPTFKAPVVGRSGTALSQVMAALLSLKYLIPLTQGRIILTPLKFRLDHIKDVCWPLFMLEGLTEKETISAFAVKAKNKPKNVITMRKKFFIGYFPKDIKIYYVIL
ncbi:MAG: hypothetical protein UV01_C0002G0105 [Parcubacteria group bacterium GW2011_GWA2_42_14]|nr:MAG: hypothetical protein UV01_C0002G0105 [Parcubacteria group bacterium GW2011_GWA2_42_14]